MDEIYKIKSKAEYIADIALDIIMSGNKIGITDESKAQLIYKQLCDIADDLTEYSSLCEVDEI